MEFKHSQLKMELGKWIKKKKCLCSWLKTSAPTGIHPITLTWKWKRWWCVVGWLVGEQRMKVLHFPLKHCQQEDMHVRGQLWGVLPHRLMEQDNFLQSVSFLQTLWLWLLWREGSILRGFKLNIRTYVLWSPSYNSCSHPRQFTNLWTGSKLWAFLLVLQETEIWGEKRPNVQMHCVVVVVYSVMCGHIIAISLFKSSACNFFKTLFFCRICQNTLMGIHKLSPLWKVSL